MKKKGMLLLALLAAAALSAGVLSACKEKHVLTYHAAVAATCTETGTVEGYSHTLIDFTDGTLLGGLYGAVCEYVLSRGYDIKVEGIGIPDRFISQARQTRQLADCGIDYEGIKKSLSKYL